MSSAFTESVVEQAGLAWLESLGGFVRHEVGNQAESRALATLPYMLRQLVSGEMRVGSAETFLRKKPVAFL